MHFSTQLTHHDTCTVPPLVRFMAHSTEQTNNYTAQQSQMPFLSPKQSTGGNTKHRLQPW